MELSMRLIAIHDDAGIIREVVTSPADAPAPVLQTAAGLTTTEIEVPAGMPEDGNLQELIRNYRIELAPQPRKSIAVRRDAPGTS
jgi:hypothetical protein